MFLVGGLWYSPLLFARPWMADNGLTEAQLQGGMLRVFGGAFLLSLLMAFNLAAFIGPDPDVSFAVAASAAAGIGWVAESFGLVYLFERKSFRLFLINGGYLAVAFLVMGVILGLWP
jgi:hypothetical protein